MLSLVEPPLGSRVGRRAPDCWTFPRSQLFILEDSQPTHESKEEYVNTCTPMTYMHRWLTFKCVPVDSFLLDYVKANSKLYS